MQRTVRAEPPHRPKLRPGAVSTAAAVEREFGRLKHDYGLAFLRVRGIERVSLHADLIMLAPLGQALVRARAVPLASA